MTVITKPLSQEKKDEKLQKEVVNINENPTKAIPDDSLALNSDSRSVCVEIAGHTHVSRRTARTRNSPSRTLFVTKICLLIPALCSIIMGFSIVLHGLLTIGTGRQMYKGYCRIPYPTTVPGYFGLTGDPIGDSSVHRFPNGGSKSFGFAARLDGNGQGAIFNENKSFYRLITGEFVNEPKLVEKTQEQKEKTQKEKAIHRMMQKLVQIALNPKAKVEKEKLKDESSSKIIHETEPSHLPTFPRAFPTFLLPPKSHAESEVQKEEKETERNFELDFDIDIGEEREELQMPELSRGKYLHDFKVNKTAIIDHEKKRCFVFDLNRKHISSPRSLFELLHGMIKGTFGINFQQIREDMEVKFPAVSNFNEYGAVIKNVCGGMDTYRLEHTTPTKTWKTAKKMSGIATSVENGNVDITNERQKKVGPSRIKRSAKEEVEKAPKDDYLEFAGKYIHYNIVNLKDIE